MTEKLSAFIDDALYTQEIKSLLNELASDNNKTTLELYLLTREILQNNHSLMLRENLSERILQSIHQEMQKSGSFQIKTIIMASFFCDCRNFHAWRRWHDVMVDHKNLP